MTRRFFFFLLILISCNGADEIKPDEDVEDKDFAIPDWTEATHGNDAQPDYGTVFPQAKINTLEITMTTEDWTGILNNVQSLFGYAFGAGGSQPGGPGSFPEQEPDYAAVSLRFNDTEWYKVGFRLKGNSTLRNSWRSGIYKLPFRLHFDKFEDDYPQIKNQRFYGFKELSMSPGANDNSLIREKAGSDIFRLAGIPCSQTAFYKVYINFGEGLKYCGVYTMVEVVDDTMIKSQFGTDDGNIYKPESTFQNFVTAQFEKKNNETESDFGDVVATINALNSPLRTTDPSQWRANLEQNFNADHFMKWLAINTTMLNWDTYGRMAHNYYLYNNPGKGLTWIPWDNNEAMMNRGATITTISLDGVGANWPLIRYLMDDPVYLEKYKEYVREFKDNTFNTQKMNELFTRYHTLISPHVIGPEAVEQGKYTYLTNPANFSSELETLKQHVIRQYAIATDFLN
jgi:spore coat protein H